MTLIRSLKWPSFQHIALAVMILISLLVLGVVLLVAAHDLKPCLFQREAYAELEHLSVQVEQFKARQGRLPNDEEIFQMSRDRSVLTRIWVEGSVYQLVAESGTDPAYSFQQRMSIMSFDAPWSHYQSSDQSISCHPR